MPTGARGAPLTSRAGTADFLARRELGPSVPDGQVIAVEGPSAAGKSSVVRRLAVSRSMVALEEVYARWHPRPSLELSTPAELGRLERRLLDAEASRWRKARRLAARGRLVLLDTGPLGPLSYTYGLVRDHPALGPVLRTLLRRARELARIGSLGIPNLTIYLDVPAAVMWRRARRTPVERPPALFARHQRVGRWERWLLLGPWKEGLRLRSLPVPRGASPARIARRVLDLVDALPVERERSPTAELGRVLALLRTLERLSPEGGVRPRDAGGSPARSRQTRPIRRDRPRALRRDPEGPSLRRPDGYSKRASACGPPPR